MGHTKRCTSSQDHPQRNRISIIFGSTRLEPNPQIAFWCLWRSISSFALDSICSMNVIQCSASNHVQFGALARLLIQVLVFGTRLFPQSHQPRAGRGFKHIQPAMPQNIAAHALGRSPNLDSSGQCCSCPGFHSESSTTSKNDLVSKPADPATASTSRDTHTLSLPTQTSTKMHTYLKSKVSPPLAPKVMASSKRYSANISTSKSAPPDGSPQSDCAAGAGEAPAVATAEAWANIGICIC